MNRSVRFLLWLASIAFSTGAASETHCRAGEIVYFSCKIKNSQKVVSLCGSPFQTVQTYERNKDAWLQYRFGKPGSRLELEFPTHRANSLSRFVSNYQHPYQAFIRSIEFQNGKTVYAVSIDSFEDGSAFNGIRITIDGADRELPCAAQAHTESAPGDNNFVSLVNELYRERK